MLDSVNTVLLCADVKETTVRWIVIISEDVEKHCQENCKEFFASDESTDV